MKDEIQSTKDSFINCLEDRVTKLSDEIAKNVNIVEDKIKNETSTKLKNLDQQVKDKMENLKGEDIESLESNLKRETNSKIHSLDEKVVGIIEDLKENIGEMTNELDNDREEQSKIIVNLGKNE